MSYCQITERKDIVSEQVFFVCFVLSTSAVLRDHSWLYSGVIPSGMLEIDPGQLRASPTHSAVALAPVSGFAQGCFRAT